MSTTKIFAIVMILAIGSSLVAACSGSGSDTSGLEAPAVPPAQPEEVLTPDAIPNTGESAAEAAPATTDAKRLWSGEVFLSENDYPDLMQPIMETACMVLGDPSSPRRHGGCAE